MKRIMFMWLWLPVVAFAQPEFTKQWETKFSVNPRWNDQTEDLSLVMAGDLSEIEMLDGTTGKSLWTINMKEKFGVKNCDDWFLKDELNAVQVLYKKPKSDDQTIVYLDARTGQEIGEPERIAAPEKSNGRYARSRDKFVFQNDYWDEDSQTLISLGYDDKKIKNAMGGNMLNVTASATGGYSWNVSFNAKVVAHLCADLIDEEVVLNLFVYGSRIYVMHEGVTVLDLKTGKVLWTTTFDYTDTDLGLRARQEIGRSAWPLVTDDAVYICDLSKDEKSIKKLNPENGQVIWTGEKLSKNDIISSLYYADGTLLVKYGGVILRESFIPSTNGGFGDGTYKVEYVFEGSAEIRAFDAATGALKWSTEKWNNGDNFKKSPCNMVTENGKLYFCSDKVFYQIDPVSGNILLKSEFGAKTIGLPQYIYFMDERLIVEGEKGISALKPDGTLIYATDTDKCLMTQWKGEAFIVWTGKAADDRNEFIRFDLNTGKILGKLEGCYHPRFDVTGDYLIRYDGNKVMRYKTTG